VDGRDRISGPYLAAACERARDFPGGVHSDGTTVTEPGELIEAKTILGLCDRFGCLPSQLAAEDAAILRLLKIEELGVRREEVPDLG